MNPLPTSDLLTLLKTMVNDVNQVNGTNDKIERIQKYPTLVPFLKLLYDPLSTTGVTSGQLEKYEQKTKKPASKKSKVDEVHESASHLNHKSEIDLVVLLNKLYRRDYSGNQAKDVILALVSQHPTHRDLILKIINKDLEIRMDVKQLNKAFPSMFTEFSVALAKDFESASSYFKKNATATWYMSRKYDGIRCIVKVNQGCAHAYSRNGNRLPALKPLEDLVMKHCGPSDSFVLDGEVCAIGPDGNENFSEAVSQAKRKSACMEKFRYYVFDRLTVPEFESGTSERILSERLNELKEWLDEVHESMSPLDGEADGSLAEKLRYVTHIPYTPETFVQLQSQASDLQWEGLMLRKDDIYKGKRSNDILKVKKFYTEEYVVTGYETGPMRMIDPSTGLETSIETLTSVQIEHKSHPVSVGSGFTLAERQRFFQDPSLIVGQTISVRYFEETPPNEEGKISLRFPTFVTLHGLTRTV